MRGRLVLFALLLAASGCKKPDAHGDADREDDRDDHRSPATATSGYRLEVDAASLDRTLTAYRQATGKDLSMRDTVRRRTDCLTFTMKLEADDADALDRAFQEKLAEKGLRVEERSGVRSVTRDYKQPAPCGPDPAPSALSPSQPSGASLSDEDAIASIERVSDDHYRMESRVLAAVYDAGGMGVLRSMRVMPVTANGKRKGLRLMRMRPEGVAAHLGFMNGDIVESVNGYEVVEPDKALETYAKLRDARHLDVLIERRGNPITIEIDVVPDGTIDKRPKLAGSASPSALPAPPPALPPRPAPASPSPMRPGTP